MSPTSRPRVLQKGTSTAANGVGLPRRRETVRRSKSTRNRCQFSEVISYYNTRSERELCGLSSVSMILNALWIDPAKIWKGNWRWIDESVLVSDEELALIKKEGVTLDRAANVASGNGAKVLLYRADQSNADSFCSLMALHCSINNVHMIVSYDRKVLGQTGAGHFSPIGAYHAESGMALILDVARYKYPPHWIPTGLLWDAVNTIDESTNLHRGYMIVSRDCSCTDHPVREV